ncbi:MAG: polyketide cyclase [Gemmatimonadetes bacterium]|nr:polyketide cyclase [Gemmatimonadota bacterium]
MSSRDAYSPGTAQGAEVLKDGEKWTLVLVRELHHPPSKVWRALTERDQLHEWAPFDADRDLDSPGPLKLSTVGAPVTQVSDSIVKRADAPKLLEYTWGGNEMRWELAPTAAGTRLTLWHNIDRNYIAMGAAGWHICLDVLDHLVGGDPLGRIVGGEAMKFEWKRLNSEYGAQFGIEPKSWTPTGEPSA